jgi:energy-converting hydrogenase Eha subunit A
VSGAGVGTAALVIIGIIIVVISILSGNPLPLAVLGVAAIAFGALLEAWVRRGRP